MHLEAALLQDSFGVVHTKVHNRYAPHDTRNGWYKCALRELPIINRKPAPLLDSQGVFSRTATKIY